ncbi:MAG: preprotein translocase subunit SecE [Parcubacteria group bacterium]
MGLKDRLDQLRKGAAGEPRAAATQPREKRERVGPLTFLKQMREELSKVSWPKRQAVVRGTVQVLIVSAIFVVLLGSVDLGLQSGLKKLIASQEQDVSTESTDTLPTTPTE